MPGHQILVEQLGMQTAASKDSCEPQVLGKPEGGQLELVPEEGPHETCGSTYSCSLNSSCWDACVLLGFKRDGGNSFLGYSEIFQILFMLIPNSAIQIIFSWWILTNFSSAPFSTSTQAGVLYQRLTDGQHFDNFDGWNLTTLATRTCNGDVISALSGEADTVAAYVKAETFTTAQAGTVIAFLAILIWTLGMVYEMRCTFRLTCSCIATRTDKSLFATLKSSGDNVYTLHQLSMAQKVGVVLLMALPRMAVASLLTVAGIQFLGYSESVSDLILNACALNVIKDVDELVFETLSSRSLKEKVGGTSVELQADTGNVFITSHQVTFFVRLILVLGLSLYGYYGLLEIVASRVQAVDTNVCSNDLEWAWTTHPLSSMPVFVSVSSDSVKSDRLDELSCLYQAKYQMLKVRGGFTTSTLKDNVSGDASACTNNRGQCSGFSMAFFRELKDLTASSIKTQHTSYCVDQDTAYTFLRSACMDHASDRPRNLTKKLQASVDCSGLAGWADCPNGATTCLPGATVANGNGVSPDWITLLQGICPKTLGMCSGSQTSNSSSTNASTLPRRLDSLTIPALGVQQNPSQEVVAVSVAQQSSNPAYVGDRLGQLEAENQKLKNLLLDFKKVRAKETQHLKARNAELVKRLGNLQRLVEAARHNDVV